MANERWRNFSVLAVVIVVALSGQLAHGGNTTCVSNQLSWYTSVVGESPCMTYQRLRQICNNDYQVPSFSSTIPGDRCDDQVSECCCNMVAFQLSMLCMVCQQDHQDSGGIGIDAPAKGTYTVYRGTCGAGVNHTLPSDLQSAICNKNIRIDNFLYDSWDDGKWYYVWTKENVERLHAANNNNTFTHCPDQISPSPTPTPTSSPTLQVPTTTSKVSSPTTPAPNTLNTQPAPFTSGGASSITSVPVSMSQATSKTNAAPEMGSSPASLGASNLSLSSSSSSAAVVQSSDADFGAGGRSKSLSHGSLIGAIVGGVLGVIIILAVVIIWRRKKLASKRLHETHGDSVVRPRSLAPNRLLDGEEGQVSPGSHDEDPFMSEISPRTPGGAVSPAAPQSSVPLTETSLRHHDAGPFVVGRPRSNSGRLPPAYDDSWDSDRGRSTHPGTDSVSAPMSNADGPRSEVSAGQTMDGVPLSPTFGSTNFHESALVATRTLPVPPNARPSDLKDRSPFD